MSEDNTQAENEAVEVETTEEASPATEEQTTQDVTEEAEVQVEEPQAEEAPEGKPKRNAESRIRELVKEKKELESRLSSEEEQPPRGNGRFSDMFAGKDNVTPEDLDRAAEQYLGQAANSIVDARLNPVLSSIQRDRLEADVVRTQTKYPELDPESDQYDPKLDEAIADNYKRYGQTERLSDFVDNQMSLAAAKAERANQKAEETISKQSEETAVRPSQSSKAETKFEDLSLDEMEEKLGLVH